MDTDELDSRLEEMVDELEMALEQARQEVADTEELLDAVSALKADVEDGLDADEFDERVDELVALTEELSRQRMFATDEIRQMLSDDG